MPNSDGGQGVKRAMDEMRQVRTLHAITREKNKQKIKHMLDVILTL